MPSSILGGLATGAAASGGAMAFNSLFGSDEDALGSFAPVGVRAGGLKGLFDAGDNEFVVKADPNRMAMVERLAALFPEQADKVHALLGQVTPGMSDLRASRMAEIENARRAAVGNLSENLAQRRVSGSSFGSDAITRAEAEFGSLKDKTAAETFLQELDLTNTLTQQEFALRRQEFTTMLDELNLEANLAASLASGATSQLGANARTSAMLDAQAMAGMGKFFGQAWMPFFNQVGTATSGMFSGGSGVMPGAAPLGQGGIGHA